MLELRRARFSAPSRTLLNRFLPDGQFAHARHAQIARRANLSQWPCSEIQKIP
jgi:hypothetical protein